MRAEYTLSFHATASQYEARHLKFEQTQKDPRELGLFSQTPLHAWRML